MTAYYYSVNNRLDNFYLKPGAYIKEMIKKMQFILL